VSFSERVKNMKKLTKKRLIIFGVILFLIASVIIYFCLHPTYWKYNDYWIIGKHYTAIEKRYGEFDVLWTIPGKTEPAVGFYEEESIIRDYLGGQKLYYIVSFDDYGIAEEIEENNFPGG
jgi:hypothetical protein